MTDLNEVMNSSFDDIPEPMNCPEGDFWFRVHKVKTDVIPNDKKTPYAELTLIPAAVVSAEGITDADLRQVYPVRGRLWLSPESLGITRDHIRKSFRVDTTGKNVAEALDALIGAEVRATVKHRHDNGKTYVEVDRWMRPTA